MQNFPEYKYDISLEHDGSNRFMVWIIACLVFIATLSMFSALASKQMIADWRSYAVSHATVEVPFAENAEEQALAAAEVLAPLDIIDEVQIIPAEETSALVTGAMGESDENVNAALLPLPVLIEVTFSKDPRDADIAEMRTALEQAAPGASLHRHEDWARDVLAYGEMLFFGAIILVVLMASMTILTLVWTLMSRINIHEDEIEILTIIGADDRYIARQFQHFALSRTFTGCMIGIALAGLVLLLASLRLDMAAVLSRFSLWEALGWLFLPLGIGLFIAYISSRATLFRTLSGLN